MLSRTAENYLREIYVISQSKGYARIRDISNALGVSPPTAIEMVGKLAKEGMVVYEKYEGIKVTEAGKRVAATLNERYQVFLKLFSLAGVSPKTAYRDACILEHYISDETNSSIAALVEELERNGLPIPLPQKRFRQT